MKPDKANAIEKALEILLGFTPYNQEMGTVEISQRLGFHKATVSRILSTLARHEFVQQNPETKKFSLGVSSLEIGNAVNQSLRSNLIYLAKPHIDRLREILKETVVLEVLSGDFTVMAYVAEGPQPVRVAASVGETLPRHAAAGLKAILAFAPPELRKRVINGNLARLTPNTITDSIEFGRMLERAKEQGVSFDREEIDLGVNAVGAPIFNFSGKAIAAVVVVGPSQRVNCELDSPIIPLLKQAAADISSALHFRDGQTAPGIRPEKVDRRQSSNSRTNK